MAGRAGDKPARQTALAGFVRRVNAQALQERLAQVADHHALSWDAYAMLSRVCDSVLPKPLTVIEDSATVGR